MTLEEKIAHLQESSMEEARSEGNQIIKSHADALEHIFNEHKAEALRQSETRIKSETTRARQQLNKAMAKSQIELKREQGKCQTELKNRLFEEVNDLINEYMKTPAYCDYLAAQIMNAAKFADGEDLTLFINPTDEDKKDALEARTGMKLTISREDFIGGIRAVIHERNILIDHSFKSAISTEYDKFLFIGGGSID